MSTQTASAPAPAMPMAMAWPMPVEAPVISARRPVSVKSMLI